MVDEPGSDAAIDKIGKSTIDAFEGWGYAVARRRDGHDVVIPLVPVEYIDWFRMRVDDLPPREFWATSVEDMGLATGLQDARRRGEDRANTEAKKEQEKQDKDRERKNKEQESIQRLRGHG